jgi:2-polyprenyl-3-methyl-5-hydroxy-6-metoxy-1,4-benzoquinol methylase
MVVPAAIVSQRHQASFLPLTANLTAKVRLTARDGCAYAEKTGRVLLIRERVQRHRTEFAVTLRALNAALPPTPARVLDIGAGPGRYSVALAAQGYQGDAG